MQTTEGGNLLIDLMAFKTEQSDLKVQSIPVTDAVSDDPKVLFSIGPLAILEGDTIVASGYVEGTNNTGHSVSYVVRMCAADGPDVHGQAVGVIAPMSAGGGRNLIPDVHHDPAGKSGVFIADQDYAALYINLWARATSSTVNPGDEIEFESASNPQLQAIWKRRTKVDGTLPDALPIISNTPPVATDDVVAGDQDTSQTILQSVLIANDYDNDNDTLTIASVSNPVNCSVNLDGSNDVLFTPDASFYGVATFDYSISDGNAGTDIATVTVNVAQAPAGPQWISIYNTALDSLGSGWGEYLIRNLFKSVSFPSNTGTKIKVTLAGPSSGSTDVQSIYVGHKAVVGDEFDMETTSQLLFSGSTNVVITANAEVVSDELNFSFDNAKDLIVSLGFSIVSGMNIGRATGVGANFRRYSKPNDAGLAGVSNVSGLSDDGQQINVVRKIEILTS